MKKEQNFGWLCAFVADDSYKTQVLIISMVEDVQTKTPKGYVTTSVKKILQKIL